MDERELANHVFEVLDQTAHRNAISHVMAVRLAIGGRRNFDLERLRSSFADVARGTVAEGARLEVKVLPVVRHCRNCGGDFEGSAADSPCPLCGHPVTEARGGEEVRVLDIQVD
ncbi:MAG TPA: hydrogenase maturation nickel metallochaperone HypA [Terriglobales bacterium]|nr:hydrogenase maturation nickel metallochaperone HypA [Terriglobales bacterium]